MSMSMRSTAFRWGAFYLLGLLVVATLGYMEHNQQDQLASLEQTNQQILGELQTLQLEKIKEFGPGRIIQWAKQNGMIPLAEGHWEVAP